MTPDQLTEKAKEICHSFLTFISFDKIPSIDKRFGDWASTPSAKSLIASLAGEGEWKPIASAPKDGSTIKVSYEVDGSDPFLVKWVDQRTCAGGRTYGEGWAQTEIPAGENLPVDEPLLWRESKSLAGANMSAFINWCNDKAKYYESISLTEYGKGACDGFKECRAQFDFYFNKHESQSLPVAGEKKTPKWVRASNRLPDTFDAHERHIKLDGKRNDGILVEAENGGMVLEYKEGAIYKIVDDLSRVQWLDDPGE